MVGRRGEGMYGACFADRSQRPHTAVWHPNDYPVTEDVFRSSASGTVGRCAVFSHRAKGYRSSVRRLIARNIPVGANHVSDLVQRTLRGLKRQNGTNRARDEPLWIYWGLAT